MDLVAGLADQSVQIAAWTTATGAPVTITEATAGLALWYRRGVAGAKVAITADDLATLETAHADGGLLVIAGAEHRLDLPDAAIAAGVLTVSWGGSATGITIDGGTANLIGQANTANIVIPDAAGTLAGLIGAKSGLPKLDASNGLSIVGYENAGASLGGDVAGKVLGGGANTPSAAGVWAVNGAGEAILSTTDLPVAASGDWNTVTPPDATAIQGAANAALVANHLDHLALTATGIPSPATGTWVALAQADRTAILARIGDFIGTGLNSIKGFLQALFRKDAGVSGANLPSEINEAENTVTGAYDAATDSQEAVRDKLPTNLEDLSVADITGLVKATDQDGAALASRTTRPPG